MEPQDYPHKFFGSRFYAFFSILMGVAFFSVVVYGLSNGRANEASVIFLLCFAVGFFIMGWKTLTSRTPVLQFGPTGMWTSKLGHLPWHTITLRLGSVYAGKAGTMYIISILERQTHRHMEGVVISGLDHSSSYIESALKSHNKADIINS